MVGTLWMSMSDILNLSMLLLVVFFVYAVAR